MPGARLGAAATVLSDGEHTISFEKALETDPTLKAKYQSFDSAMDAEACRATGRPPELAAAMKDKKATLFYTPDIGFTSLRQNGSSIELDSDETILTLTTKQLVDYKLAKQVATVEEAQKAIGVFDEAVSKKMAITIRQMSKQVAALEKGIDQLCEEYKRHRSAAGSRQTEGLRQRMLLETEQKLDKKLKVLVQLLQAP
jgi:phosphate-selective porin